MATIVTRSGKGSALTHTEMDNNFTNLNTDKPDVVGTPATDNLASFDASDDVQDSGIATSAVTTLTGTQTLTNKTLTSPVINTPDINGGTWNGTIDGNVVVGGATLSTTELSYIDGVTSNIQTQINNTAGRRGALVKDTIGQSISDAVTTAITFNAEEYDTDSIHSTSVNTERLTVPAGITKVRLTGGCFFASNTTGFRRLIITKNGVTFAGSPTATVNPVSGDVTYMNIVSPIVVVTGGDYFEFEAYQNSGGSLTVGSSWFAMEIIE